MGEFRFIDMELQQQLVGVNRDSVTFLDKGDRAALVGFRRNVSDHHAPGAS